MYTVDPFGTRSEGKTAFIIETGSTVVTTKYQCSPLELLPSYPDYSPHTQTLGGGDSTGPARGEATTPEAELIESYWPNLTAKGLIYPPLSERHDVMVPALSYVQQLHKAYSRRNFLFIEKGRKCITHNYNKYP